MNIQEKFSNFIQKIENLKQELYDLEDEYNSIIHNENEKYIKSIGITNWNAEKDILYHKYNNIVEPLYNSWKNLITELDFKMESINWNYRSWRVEHTTENNKPHRILRTKPNFSVIITRPE